ncbi:hypothetical protein AAVH_22944 [Aphelenchoides avenae]|nr:hypothetical protein AAVH_22944 [Aphelenchus avenae]
MPSPPISIRPSRATSALCSTSPATSSRFSMVFHADLNLPGPRFFSSVADRFKPKLMVEKVNKMRTAIASLHMPQDDE